MKDQLDALARPQLIALIVQKDIIQYSDAIQMTKPELVAILFGEGDDVLDPTPA